MLLTKSRTVPRADEVMVPESLLKKRRSQAAAAQDVEQKKAESKKVSDDGVLKTAAVDDDNYNTSRLVYGRCCRNVNHLSGLSTHSLTNYGIGRDANNETRNELPSDKLFTSVLRNTKRSTRQESELSLRPSVLRSRMASSTLKLCPSLRLSSASRVSTRLHQSHERRFSCCDYIR